MTGFAAMALQIRASHRREQNLPVQGGFHSLLMLGMAFKAGLSSEVGGILDCRGYNRFAEPLVKRAMP